ncbi:aspartoacylase [Thermoleptolyngbya sichuanensis A183]|uniref:Probable aspartoacylase n=1 Tax=Thermoleptolyngbya sichuanensis A183 TaxID=2737172 RepID=A0A6M8B4B4_9CYAN|nr:aspartoacylase [Thermoleptolyngbya sichuanensis]QKD82049.1 aspartoacylase [Thermoleptolyngbya sichuanensis A183]
MDKIRRVLLVGGTHGNELTGIYLIRRFQHAPQLISRPSFETITLLSNLEAIAAGVRYVDQDMNRCCDRAHLELPEPVDYEVRRAQEINRRFGPSGSTPADVILDIHSTTSNMGMTLILDDHHPFKLRLAAALSAQQPDLRIYSSVNSGRQQDALRSLGRFGICLEVGPVAQGVLQADLFQRTEALVQQILDVLNQQNRDEPLPTVQPVTTQPVTTQPVTTQPVTTQPVTMQPLTVYQYLGTMPYPRDTEGQITAMIHPHLQGRDYESLNPGDPIFLSLTGETLLYTGETVVFPVFINEAAYYEKDIAMVLTQRHDLQVDFAETL